MEVDTYINWTDDWANWLDDLDEDSEFYTDLDNYSWVPDKIGDRFSIRGQGHGVGREVYEILKIEDEGWDSFNNITYIMAGDVPDEDGYYTRIGSISSEALRLYDKLGSVVKRGRATPLV